MVLKHGLWPELWKIGMLLLTTCASDVFYRFPTQTMLPMLMYDSEPSHHHSCCCSSKQDSSVFAHVARTGDSQDTFRAIHTSIRELPNDWSHHPERPCHTWLWTLEVDLELLYPRLNSAWQLAQDRERWRQIVETATLQSGARPR